MAKRRIAYVGDSMGVGTAPNVKGRVKANVVGGRSSADGVTALKQILNGGRYGQVVFDLGTNDPDKRALKQSLNRALRLADGATVVVPTVRGPNAAEKNKLIRRYARQGKIDLVRWAGNSKGLLSSDDLHATPAGYEERARMIEAALGDTAPSTSYRAKKPTRKIPAVSTSGLTPAAMLAMLAPPDTEPAPTLKSLRSRRT